MRPERVIEAPVICVLRRDRILTAQAPLKLGNSRRLSRGSRGVDVAVPGTDAVVAASHFHANAVELPIARARRRIANEVLAVQLFRDLLQRLADLRAVVDHART